MKILLAEGEKEKKNLMDCHDFWVEKTLQVVLVVIKIFPLINWQWAILTRLVGLVMVVIDQAIEKAWETGLAWLDHGKDKEHSVEWNLHGDSADLKL